MSIQLQVVLADYAVAHDGKLMMAGAGWSHVGSGPFGCALAFMAKVPWDMANQRLTIHAELVDEDGHPALVNERPLFVDISFDVTRPPHLRPGSDVDQNFAINIPQLMLPPGRTYEWRVSVNGEQRRDWNRSFSVRPPVEQTPPSI